MIRHTKIARDTAVKARTQAMVTLKALLVTVPDELREQLTGLSKMALLERCAGLRPGPMSSTVASAKRALRALARRWLDLDQEIKEHDILLEQLTTSRLPNSSTPSASAPTPPPKCSSWSATTPNASAPKPHLSAYSLVCRGAYEYSCRGRQDWAKRVSVQLEAMARV
jgi:hypothetical protein